MSASYVYEFYLRKNFLKKENFFHERKIFIQEREKYKKVLGTIIPKPLIERLTQEEAGKFFEKTLNILL